MVDKRNKQRVVTSIIGVIISAISITLYVFLKDKILLNIILAIICIFMLYFKHISYIKWIRS